jgi:hypothetical protein
MIKFSEHDVYAQKLAIHYANMLGDEYASRVMSLSAEISTQEEAENITRFYWAMVDLAVEDQEHGREIEGTTDLEFWMEKLLNIIMGYLNRIGFREQWAKTSDELNGR